MRHDIEPAGEVKGRPVAKITLENDQGMKVAVLTYGCIVQSVLVPDRSGNIADATLGYGELDAYLKGHPFFGSIAGRFANRICEGRFTLNGKTYTLECNEAPTGQHLHGGTQGFDKAVWGYGIEERDGALALNLYHTSPDGDAGYPGRLDVVHTIWLDQSNALGMEFRAVSDRDTILNLVNHSYYNLSGIEGTTVEDHELSVSADTFIPVDDRMLPTGAIAPVAGTEFDFRAPRRLSDAFIARPDGSFDNNFCLGAAEEDGLRPAADLYHPPSGRGMRVRTTQPGVQFYNGAKLSNRAWYGRNGTRYPAYAGLCLETQHFPDSPNRPQFPTTTLRAGQLWEQRTVHAFYTR
ncbi:aldose 1-epimerase [Aliiruegeria haliotis]|uniref:Aldose 1-epimerase n=1 Tax=Aliiruegeria haliotis TaxID=1280846 RepID=A0A2T0RSW5_9RHOB|nr:aldose epimerase family protein [Aliiruegeria haliotis]PRY24274.1 aldose 1-epimerase [Aliiruegeria haliotis]